MRLAWFVPVLALVGCGQPENSPPGDAPGAATTPPGSEASAPPAAPGTGGPIHAGSKVTFHFRLLADGKTQQDSHGQEPGTYVQGSGQMFPALERALEGLEPGDKKSVTLKPEDSFGPRIADAIRTVPRSSLPGADSMKVGNSIGGNVNGRRVGAIIQKMDADSITLDMNHPLAGKDVTFEVEIVSVQ